MFSFRISRNTYLKNLEISFIQLIHKEVRNHKDFYTCGFSKRFLYRYLVKFNIQPLTNRNE